MTKLHVAGPPPATDSFKGIMKYYAAAALIGLVAVAGVAWGMLSAGPG